MLTVERLFGYLHQAAQCYRQHTNGGGIVRYRILLSLLFLVLFCPVAFCQESQQNDLDLRHTIGSSLFLLGNIIPEDPIYAFQLDYGYRLTRKDVLIVEAIA
jgi:hypothetical protein